MMDLHAAAAQGDDEFLLIVCFGECVAESLMPCRWVDRHCGVFRPLDDGSVASYMHVSDFARFRHSVISA
jgi:hypothetical protein